MQATSIHTPPAAAAVVTHEIESYERWKHAFDGDLAARRSAGIATAHVNRDAEHPGRVSVYLAAADAAQLAAFLKSPDLATRMLDAGVKGPPSITAITPVEDHTQKRALAGVIVRHAVSDYAAWKRAFDGDAPQRATAGIVGHAINRSVQDPDTVIVYLQAETLDALRAFTSAPRLKALMQASGVVGAPTFAFVQGGTWES